MRKAVLLVLALCLASPPLAAIKNRTQKTTLTLHALASPAVPHEKTTPWTGAYSNTSCAGSGMYGGYSSPLDVNCRALPAPPQAIPITIGRLVVQGQLEGDGKVYTVACTAHWVGSGCGWLTPGNPFKAEVRGTTMWINASHGGDTGKPIRAKHRILDVRPRALIWTSEKRQLHFAGACQRHGCGYRQGFDTWFLRGRACKYDDHDARSSSGGHLMSLYLVSCEFSSGSEGYEKFNEQLGVLRAVQILNRRWLVRHNQGKAKKLRDFLNPYLDNGDRLLVQEVTTQAMGMNLLVDDSKLLDLLKFAKG